MEYAFTDNELKLERFWVSQAALIIKSGKLLILKNSAKEDEWLFPGGRADIGEIGDDAFARELKEEIGVNDFTKIVVVDYDIWYTMHRHIPVCTIANLVDIKDEEIKLSFEHTEFRWITESEVANYNFAWPKAIEFIHKAFKLHKQLV